MYFKMVTLKNIFQNVREIEILFGACDWCEIPDVIKILRKRY